MARRTWRTPFLERWKNVRPCLALKSMQLTDSCEDCNPEPIDVQKKIVKSWRYFFMVGSPACARTCDGLIFHSVGAVRALDGKRALHRQTGVEIIGDRARRCPYTVALG